MAPIFTICKSDNVRLLGLYAMAFLLGNRLAFSLQAHGRINTTVQNSTAHCPVTSLSRGGNTGKKVLPSVECLPLGPLPIGMGAGCVLGTGASKMHGIVYLVP